jgi:hypothetical protein
MDTHFSGRAAGSYAGPFRNRLTFSLRFILSNNVRHGLINLEHP